MKHKWYLALIAISLIALIGSITGCDAIVIVRDGSESTTEQPPPPPIINSFTASPSSITQGQRTTLSWDVSGATTINIQPEIGTAGPSGSLQLTPNASVTYTLTAVNESGSSTSSVSVAVMPGFAGKPDLVIKDIWLTGGQVNYTIANIGDAESKPSQSYFYVNDLKQASDWVDALAAGEEKITSIPNFEWKYQTGIDVTSGEFFGYDVKICADAGNAIDESNKDNNCLTKSWGQKFTYDFLQNANLAEWRSSAAAIKWPKFAGSQEGAAYMEGTALIMCPEQITNGWVQGRFANYYYETVQGGTDIKRSTLIEVPANARFSAEVGFNPSTAASTDGVGIALGYVDEFGSIVLFPKMELSPGDKSRAYTVDLSPLAGETTEFVLRVEAKGSPEGDCVRWMEPKIVQE